MSDEILPMPTPEEPEKIKLELAIWPDKVLKYPASTFPEEHVGSPLVRSTAQAMTEMMYHYRGVGLAAQQVHVPFQIFVMDAQINGEKTPKVFINPRVTEVSEEMIQVDAGEGCLSFPYGYRAPVARYKKLELEWVDFDGVVHHQWFEDAEAIIIQHELDHLMGYCFIDRISQVKRDMAINKARRIRAGYKKGMSRTLSQMKNAPRTPAFNLDRMKRFEALQRTKEKTDVKETTTPTDIRHADA